MGFDAMADIPTTDDQAETALLYGKSELTGKCLVGIFQCRRAEGEGLLAAYETALLASLGVATATVTATVGGNSGGESEEEVSDV